jgi:hypothetical protein
MANLEVEAPHEDPHEEVILQKRDVEDCQVGVVPGPSVVVVDAAATSVGEHSMDPCATSTLENKPKVSGATLDSSVDEKGSPLRQAAQQPSTFADENMRTIETNENVALTEISEAEFPTDSIERRNRSDSFDLDSMMEPVEEGDTSEGGLDRKEAAKDIVPSKSKDQRNPGKIKSPLKKVELISRSPVGSPPKKPLMDLRHILKKHEKKTETQQMHESGSIDFYGSMSSIPFLKVNKPPEQKKKGKRVAKDKMPKKSVIEESPLDDDGKGKKKISIVTEARDGQKRTTEVTIISDYDQDDLSTWRNMSSVDGKVTEEVSDRPRDMLPLVPVSSPKKVEEGKPSPQHNQRGFHRPDDWVEFGHPTKRSPVKPTYRTKAIHEVIAIDAPSVFSDDERRPAKSSPEEISQPLQKVPVERCTESIPKKSNASKESVKSPLSRTTTVSHKGSGPSKTTKKINVEESKTNGSIPPQLTKSPRKRDNLKVCQVTELAIQFQDGCVVNGQFRPTESVQRVIQDLTRDLLRNDIPLPSFDLCVESADKGRKILNPSMTLEELNLVPSASVYVEWTKPMDSAKKSGWYLQDDDEDPTTN